MLCCVCGVYDGICLARSCAESWGHQLYRFHLDWGNSQRKGDNTTEHRRLETWPRAQTWWGGRKIFKCLAIVLWILWRAAENKIDEACHVWSGTPMTVRWWWWWGVLGDSCVQGGGGGNIFSLGETSKNFPAELFWWNILRWREKRGDISFVKENTGEQQQSYEAVL